MGKRILENWNGIKDYAELEKQGQSQEPMFPGAEFQWDFISERRVERTGMASKSYEGLLTVV